MPDQHETEKQEKQPDVEKRNRIKGLMAGGAVVAGSTVWSKPVVNSLILPAHAQTSPASGSGPGTGAAMLSYTVTDPATNVTSPGNAPFGFRVGMVNASTGDFEVMISPNNQTAHHLDTSPGALDWLVQPAIAQTTNQIVITGGTLTGTVDLVNGGEAEAEGNLILGTGAGVGCDCPVLFTIQYNAQTRRIEFDQAAFELDYDIREFIGTCASLNLNITELGGVTITAQAEDFEAVPVLTTTMSPGTGFAPADAAEFHTRFNTALRTPGNWRKFNSWDKQRTLELSADGTTAFERFMHDRNGDPRTGGITYDAGWTYRKTGPNAGTLFLMDNPSDYEYDRTLHLTFESPRSGSARYVEYEPNPDPNEEYDYTLRFEW